MKCLIVLLLTGKLICELHGLIYWLWPQTATLEFDLFLSPNYHQKISILWYIFELTNILKDVICDFAFYKAATLLSNKLSKSLIVFFFADVLQAIFYAWNRNTSFFNNYILYIYVIGILLLILIPDKTNGKVKQF